MSHPDCDHCKHLEGTTTSFGVKAHLCGIAERSEFFQEYPKECPKGKGMVLHLTLKKHWYDMIASGVKVAEYREFKPYWEKRLKKFIDALERGEGCFVKFRNGYRKDSPAMTYEMDSIVVMPPCCHNEFFGEPDCRHYAIFIKERGCK